MKTKEKIICFLGIFLIVCWLIYTVRSILTPFIFSLVIAYFLNPVVDRCYKDHKISRLRATSLITGLFFSIIVSCGSLIFPVLYSQTLDFADALPGYLSTFTNDFYPRISVLMNKVGLSGNNDLMHLAAKEQITSKIFNFSKDMLGNIINSSAVLIDIFSLIFITPILIFYFLKDWNVMIEKINSYLPSSGAAKIRKIFREIDQTMSGYIRGQFNVCLILGIIYSALLSVTGLNFGFLIGFLTGMLVFIPYVGMLIGISSAIIVALFQWGFDLGNIGLVALVFLFGQIIESNFLTPSLVGSKVGLHPLWLIFGLFFFGALLGFVGILFAVPLTAISGVIIRNLAAEYKKRFA